MGFADAGTALALSAAVGSGAFMLVFTEAFAWLRAPAAHRMRGQDAPRWIWRKLYGLLACPYCTGTWLALAAVAVYRPVLVSVPGAGPGWSYWPLGYLTSVMAVNGTAMLWVLVVKKALGK